VSGNHYRRAVLLASVPWLAIPCAYNPLRGSVLRESPLNFRKLLAFVSQPSDTLFTVGHQTNIIDYQAAALGNYSFHGTRAAAFFVHVVIADGRIN
jgi:hypothetical protein